MPLMVIGGTAGSFLGEYQAGGVIVVLGIEAKDKKIVGDVELIGLENSEIDFVSNFVKLEPYYVKVENKHTLVPEYLKEESAYLVK